MARTIVVSGFGTFVGKRSGRLLLRGPVKVQPEPVAAEEAANKAHALAEPERAASPASADVEQMQGAQTALKPVREICANKRSEEEIPLLQIGEIVLPARGVSVSVELLAEAAERGITVSFLGASGKPYALLSSPMLTATVVTRREQLRAFDDDRGVEVCRRIVAGKLRNQAGLLAYFAKGLRDADAERKKRVMAAVAALRGARSEAMRVRGATVDAIRPTLMGIEGAAGRSYWGGVAALCEGRCRFEGRRRAGDVGPVNALLNYGYGILYSRVWAAVLNAGLDPFAGYLHTDRPGKPSLVLDMVEELRAPVVDRPVLAHVGLGKPVRFDGNLLDEDTRRTISDAVIERLESPVRYGGRRLRLSSVIQHQVRSLATFLRREGTWRSFTMYW